MRARSPELRADQTVTVHRHDGSVFFDGDTTGRRPPTIDDAIDDPARTKPPREAQPTDLDTLRAGLAEALDVVVARNRQRPPP